MKGTGGTWPTGALLPPLLRLLEAMPWVPSLHKILLRPSMAANSHNEIDDVFLARLRRAMLVSDRRLSSGRVGEHPSPRRANALEFADYRSYTPGDDLRRVDWNAYMRLDHPFVKLADAPERLGLHVLLDASGSMASGHPDKFAYARRVAVGLAYIALAHMDPVSLLALHGKECLQLTRHESPSAIASIMRAAASLEPRGATDLNAALASYAARSNHRGVAVLISDLLSPPGYQEGLERLSRLALRPVVIHVVSQEEMNPPLEGDLELQDVETSETIQVSVDLTTLSRYRRWVTEWLSEIESLCYRNGFAYVRVETSCPVEELLLHRLRREKVLR